jgi:MFS family permease
VIRAPYSTVLAAFAATSATATVLGVVFGGWIVDKFGGYQGAEGVFRTSMIGTGLGVCAVAVALAAIETMDFVAVLTCVWFLLFFGGAIVPGATGMVLSSVPPQLRAFSSFFAFFLAFLDIIAAPPPLPSCSNLHLSPNLHDLVRA